jgi:hypothetical protein
VLEQPVKIIATIKMVTSEMLNNLYGLNIDKFHEDSKGRNDLNQAKPN